MTTGIPAILVEIADVAGWDAAWAIARERGGQTVSLPARAIAGHWLVDLVGMEAAKQICDHFQTKNNASYVLIPMATAARRAARWDNALGEGQPINQTAAELGVHRRTVFRHKKRRTQQPPDPRKNRQGWLF